MPQSMNDYTNKARQAIDGSYALRLQQLQQAKNNQLAEYDQNAIDTNTGYDKQLKTNSDNGVQRVNNYNNSVLARGMGRSSIATTGIAGINNETANSANDINLARQNRLNEISRARQAYNQNYDSNVAALNADEQAAIQKYAQDLYNTDLAYERQQALARQAAARSSSSSAASSKKNFSQQAWQEYASAVNGGGASAGSNWLEQNADIIKSVLGDSGYNELVLTNQQLAVKERNAQHAAFKFNQADRM